MRRPCVRGSWRSAAALAFAATAATCVIFTGGNPQKDSRIRTGRGGTAEVNVRPTGRFVGELLSAGDSGIHLLTEEVQPRLIFVPAALVQSVRVKPWVLAEDFPPSDEGWIALRGTARFSHAIPAEAMTALLGDLRRAAVDTFRATPPQDDEFLRAAREGTERYQSVAAAAADGFKRVGTEFPFMGEHWVNLPRVLDDRFDPATPSVLIYVNARGARVLAGVGYTALLGAGETPPRSAAPASAWHEHNGSVVEESLPIHGGPAHQSDRIVSSDDSLRLAVLHAWVWELNPAGMFETDNRALPLLRAGRTVALDVASLLGLTLAQDSVRYYAQTVRTALRATEQEALIIDSLVASHQLKAVQADSTQLAPVWHALWRELERVLPGKRDALLQLRSHYGT